MSLNSSSLDSWAGQASATRSRVSGRSPIQASSPSESADCNAWESWSWMGASVPSCGGFSVGSEVGELAGVAVNVAVGVSVGISVGAGDVMAFGPGVFGVNAGVAATVPRTVVFVGLGVGVVP